MGYLFEAGASCDEEIKELRQAREGKNDVQATEEIDDVKRVQGLMDVLGVSYTDIAREFGISGLRSWLQRENGSPNTVKAGEAAMQWYEDHCSALQDDQQETRAISEAVDSTPAITKSMEATPAMSKPVVPNTPSSTKYKQHTRQFSRVPKPSHKVVCRLRIHECHVHFTRVVEVLSEVLCK